MEKIHRILIVDDHKLFREGLALGISRYERFKIVGEASTGMDFLNLLEQAETDIAIMDLLMPGIDGIEATEKALALYPGLKVIALTMFCNPDSYNRMMQAGASGYVLKDSGLTELIKALDTVAAGQQYFSQKIIHRLILNSNRMFMEESNQLNNNITEFLPVELQILRLLCHGYSNQQISKILAISQRALEDHKSDMYEKTGVKDSLNLAIYALKNKIVDL